jgi:hypothetical protein
MTAERRWGEWLQIVTGLLLGRTSSDGLQKKSGHLTMPANPNNQTLPPFRQGDWRAVPGGDPAPTCKRTTPLRRVEFQNCSIIFVAAWITDYTVQKPNL